MSDMMRKSAGFQIVYGEIPEAVAEQVTALMGQGWKLHGHLEVVPARPPYGTHYVQALYFRHEEGPRRPPSGRRSPIEL